MKLVVLFVETVFGALRFLEMTAGDLFSVRLRPFLNRSIMLARHLP